MHERATDIYIKPPPVRVYRSNGGLSPEEKEIHDHIVAAWNGFIKLKQTHPNDRMEFHRGIHAMQDILGARVLRRDYPDFWLDKGNDKSPPGVKTF